MPVHFDLCGLGQGFDRYSVPRRRAARRGDETLEQLVDWLPDYKGVPLFVWSPRSDTRDAGWGPSTDVSTLSRFARAIDALRKRLDSQRVVWVEGRHLGGRIELAESARRIRLSG